METLDLSRRGVLLNDEQLGPYPLEKLKRVERLTVDIVEDSPRVDEKEMAFAKCRLGGFGDVLKKRMEDFTVRVPIGASYYHFQKYLNDYPENEVAPEKAPLPEDTRIVTRHIKKMAYFTGAEMVGVCEVPRDVYYATKVDGTPVERVYRYAVVFLVRTQLPTIAASHGDEWLDDTVAYQAYQRLACMSNTLADYIRRLGWPARSDAFNNYVTIMPRLVALAGLGEFSRLGIVVNPFVGGGLQGGRRADRPAPGARRPHRLRATALLFRMQNLCRAVPHARHLALGNRRSTAATCSGGPTSAGVWPTGRPTPTAVPAAAAPRCAPSPGRTAGRSASQDWDGDLSVLYRSVEARRKFLASHGYVEPEEEHGKWWLPPCGPGWKNSVRRRFRLRGAEAPHGTDQIGGMAGTEEADNGGKNH
ncbi:4Fe-4S dicluster domain-containing protein [Flavonifractor plautii]|uniref:4Fe-4S dicluster domain-containing protein n=1 Tax=Flavonifractor plautii TaxID=292800 RepID=UPI003EED8E7B